MHCMLYIIILEYVLIQVKLLESMTRTTVNIELKLFKVNCSWPEYKKV